MMGISAPVQVSRSAYRAACGSRRAAGWRGSNRYYNRVTDHVLTRHIDILNYKSADSLDGNSAAIIRSQRFLETSADNFSYPSRWPLFGAGFFSEQRHPFNFLRASNFDHRGGVRDKENRFSN
jgi:hypothetical protein